MYPLLQSQTLSVDAEGVLLNDARDKAQKAAELQQRIQARLAAKPDLLTGVNAGAAKYHCPVNKINSRTSCHE